MPNYKIEGKANTKGKKDRPVKITLYAGNEYIARIKATDYMHKIDKVKEIK